MRTDLAELLKNLKRWTSARRAHLPLQMRPATARVVRQPLGVVLIIAPWNYPIQLTLAPLMGALAAGDTVLLKPSELAPHTSALLAHLIPERLDPRVVRVVEGGAEVTGELLAHRWDHIFFTGSQRVGRIVARAAAEQLTPVTLELGGKSPVWVDPSADLEKAAGWIAWGKFLNAGQTCIAPDHVLTTPEVAPRLVAELGRQIEKLYGADPHSSPDYARMVNPEHLHRVQGLLSGEQVAIGGEAVPTERYLAPTVLQGVRPDAPVMREEIFGPVLPVVEVDNVAAAIAMVRSSPKPLALYVFARSRSVVTAFEQQTSSGSMAVNATMVQIGASSLPFGGVGASGFGSYHGERSVQTFSHDRSVLQLGSGPNLLSMARPPFTAGKEKLLRR